LRNALNGIFSNGLAKIQNLLKTLDQAAQLSALDVLNLDSDIGAYKKVDLF